MLGAVTKTDEVEIVVVEPSLYEPTEQEKALLGTIWEEARRSGLPPVPWVTPFEPSDE